MGFAAFVFGQSTDVQLKTKFLTLLAEDIAREKQRVGNISNSNAKEGAMMQTFQGGGFLGGYVFHPRSRGPGHFQENPW